MKCAIALVLGFATVALGASVPQDEAFFSPHLIGGEKVKHMDFPYSIRFKMIEDEEHRRYCGAVRLNDYWFVTAAECLDTDKYMYVSVTHPQDGNGDPFITKTSDLHKYAQVHIHPNYNNKTKENNIALLYSEHFKASYLDPMVLPQLPKKSEQNSTFSGYTATVSGWTINNPTADEQDEDTIQKYETKMVNNFVCKLVYFFTLRSEHICASSWGGKRITEAHAGVPLVVKEGSEPNSGIKLIGIGSSVRPWTTFLPVPAVFTNVAPYAEWISQTTGIRQRE